MREILLRLKCEYWIIYILVLGFYYKKYIYVLYFYELQIIIFKLKQIEFQRKDLIAKILKYKSHKLYETVFLFFSPTIW